MPLSLLTLSIILGYLLLAMIYRWDARFALGTSIVLLLATATLLTLGAREPAEQIANVALYCIGAALVLSAIEKQRDLN